VSIREEIALMRPERDVDVLVVGSGAAGLAAALSARENGARNVLIAGRYVGGAACQGHAMTGS
jgi:succinate dehydrogenase/fumarate reductase flavoprotein subunit